MRELMGKKPAEIVSPAQLPRQEILTADLRRKGELLAYIRTMARRGEIGATYDLRRTENGWAVKVVRIADRPGWWSRNGLKATLWGSGVLAFLAVATYLVRLLTLALAAALPLLGGAVVVLIILAAIVTLSRGDSVSVTQIVKIKR